jgi:DNA-binding GntR family transcriptional regulator
MIFETLRRRISTNAYPPGTALKEVQLAAEFGVSRTPIRQVLQRLEYGGLVQPVVGHGTIVSGLDLPRMREVIQFRIQLALILKNFLDLSDVSATLERLSALRKRQDRLREFPDPIEFAEISHEIRDCIHGHISNRYMAETWQTSYYIASRLWFGGLETSGARFVQLQGEELDAITLAFASRDPAILGETVHETLTRWVEAVSDAMRLV